MLAKLLLLLINSYLFEREMSWAKAFRGTNQVSKRLLFAWCSAVPFPFSFSHAWHGRQGKVSRLQDRQPPPALHAGCFPLRQAAPWIPVCKVDYILFSPPFLSLKAVRVIAFRGENARFIYRLFHFINNNIFNIFIIFNN